MTPQQRLDYVLLPNLRQRLEEILYLLRDADRRDAPLRIDSRVSFYAGALLGALDSLDAERRDGAPVS